MKTFFVVLASLCLFNNAAFSITYYVSTTGTATNQGTMAAPFSLAKVNTSTFAPGDSILLKRGETFYGTLDFKGNGTLSASIVVGAYGTGARPVVTGLTTLKTWKALKGGLYESVLSTAPSKGVVLLLFNGALRPFGRYPKSGFLTISTHVGSTRIGSAGLRTAPQFIGGEVVQKKVQWIIDRAIVTKQSPSSIDISPFVSPDHPSVTYENVDGHGFYFQNHPNACTLLGDWSYNTSTRKITMFFGKDAPSAHNVQVATLNRLLSLANRSNITFNGISFAGANDNLIELDFTVNCKFNDCEFAYAGVNGIAVSRSGYTGTNGNSLTNSSVHHINNNGLDLIGSTGWTITNNSIRDIGMNSGMGISGDGQYEGVFDLGGNSTFRYNTLANVGYIGVKFIGSNVTISNNVLDGSNLVKGDGGGIYTYGNTGTNRIIESNIVSNSLGNIAGLAVDTLNPYNRRGMGIYMDDYASDIIIRNNTAFKNGYAGLYLNSNAKVTATGNTLYNNTTTQAGAIEMGAAFSGIVMNNNILFATAQEQLIGIFRTFNNNYAANWSLNNNYYCRPNFEPDGIVARGYSKSPTLENYPDGGIIQAHDNLFYSLDTWKNFSKVDVNTVKSPSPITNLNQLKFDYATNVEKTVQLDPAYSYKDAKGVVYRSSVSLAPYTSIVLIQVPLESATASTARAADTTAQEIGRQSAGGNANNNGNGVGAAHENENATRHNPPYAFKGAKTVPYPPAALPEERATLAADFSFTAYPVPFSNTATIQVSLTQPGQVSLALFDVQGRLVKNIFSGKLAAKRSAFTLSSKDLANGIYFLRLETGTTSVTKEISLAR